MTERDSSGRRRRRPAPATSSLRSRGDRTIVDDFVHSFTSSLGDLLGKPIVVALSGGSDSVALLLLLHGGAPRLGCPLVAAHVHHHLRAEGDADAEFCGSLCRSLGVPFTVEHLDPTPPHGVSPEAWWRGERYRLLGKAREETGCAATATAHTLDDQAETVLLKLLRGAGPRGVAGIRRRAGSVIRPLLDFSRSALRAWLVERGVDWREDATNLDGERPRAWLRRDVMPLLATRDPRVREHLAAFADTLAEDEAYFAELLAATGVWPEPGKPVPVAAIAALPAVLRRRWLLALADRLPLVEPPSRKQISAVERLLAGGQPAAVDLGRRWVLRRRGARLHLSPPTSIAVAHDE